MKRRQHALVQDSDDDDVTVRLPSKEHHVLSLLEAPILRTWSVDTPAGRILGKALTARFQVAEVPEGLLHAPPFESVRTDGIQIRFGARREPKVLHDLARR